MDTVKAGESYTPRSGDTHVIDGAQEHAEAVNVDAQAREAAAAAAVGAPSGNSTSTAAPAAEPSGDAPEPIDPKDNGPRSSRGAAGKGE